MAVNGMGPMDPNAYAQKYAAQKGISVEQAKQELRATHGDPSMSLNGSIFGNSATNSSQSIFSFGNNNNSYDTGSFNFGFNNSSPEKQLEDLGIPKNVIKKGDDAIRKFAEENDIKIPRKLEKEFE